MPKNTDNVTEHMTGASILVSATEILVSDMLSLRKNTKFHVKL